SHRRRASRRSICGTATLRSGWRRVCESAWSRLRASRSAGRPEAIRAQTNPLVGSPYSAAAHAVDPRYFVKLRTLPNGGWRWRLIGLLLDPAVDLLRLSAELPRPWHASCFSAYVRWGNVKAEQEA